MTIINSNIFKIILFLNISDKIKSKNIPNTPKTIPTDKAKIPYPNGSSIVLKSKINIVKEIRINKIENRNRTEIFFCINFFKD